MRRAMDGSPGGPGALQASQSAACANATAPGASVHLTPESANSLAPDPLETKLDLHLQLPQVFAHGHLPGLTSVKASIPQNRGTVRRARSPLLPTSVVVCSADVA